MVGGAVRGTRLRRSPGEIVFDTANTILLVVLCATTLYPFLRILAVSLSAPYALTAFPLSLIPRGFTLASYSSILSYKPIINGFRNSVVITVVCCILGLLMKGEKADITSGSSVRATVAGMTEVAAQ